MGKLLLDVSFVVWAAWTLTSCQTSSERGAAPLPESEQVIRNSLKDLYMAVAAAPPQSAEQKRLVLRMADKAANGKELMLTMRAAAGGFGSPSDDEIQFVVATKMMKVATLDQLTDYERQYEIPPASARPYVERMLELGKTQNDPGAWRRIRAAASRLKFPDLAQAAQTKATE